MGKQKRWLAIRPKLQFYLEIVAASIYKANWVTERISWVMKSLDCFLPLLSSKCILKYFSFCGKRRKNSEEEVAESIHWLASPCYFGSLEMCFSGAVWNMVTFSLFLF